jgi:transcriptional regulator with XRE-family HTH domain
MYLAGHFMAVAFRNPRAGALLTDLRRDLGLSPEALSYAIYRAGYGSVSARTIRRVERDGMVPRVRAQFALAQFFGRPVSSIWATSTPAYRKVAA